MRSRYRPGGNIRHPKSPRLMGDNSLSSQPWLDLLIDGADLRKAKVVLLLNRP